jgi:hypothetical protein
VCTRRCELDRGRSDTSWRDLYSGGIRTARRVGNSLPEGSTAIETCDRTCRNARLLERNPGNRVSEPPAIVRRTERMDPSKRGRIPPREEGRSSVSLECQVSDDGTPFGQTDGPQQVAWLDRAEHENQASRSDTPPGPPREPSRQVLKGELLHTAELSGGLASPLPSKLDGRGPVCSSPIAH